MAWTSPSTFVAGAVLSAAQMNIHVRDNPNALRTGGIAIASQAVGDVIYASSATQFARLAAGTAGQFLQANGAAAPTFASGGWLLLKANSGTDTNAGATNVDTYAMASGLTAKDTLIVFCCMEAVTQAVATPVLYNSTDSVTICSFTTMAAADDNIVSTYIRQAQSAATRIFAQPGGSASPANTIKSNFVTAWTGAWTLAFRHGGVTAGGTFKWSWAVYLVRGQ